MKFVAILLLSTIALSAAYGSQPPVSIAISQIVNHPALDATRSGIVDELASQGYIAGKNLHYKVFSAQGDLVLSNQIAKQIIASKPDYAVAIGTAMAQSLVSASKASNIPIIFSSITDPLGAKLLQDIKRPGKNITGVSNFIDVGQQLDLFKSLLPSMRRIGFLYNPGEPNSVKILKLLQRDAQLKGIEVSVAVATKPAEIAASTQKLVSMVDAIFISNDNTALSAFALIAKIALKSHIPVFVSDTDLVSQGALASMGPSQYELGRQTARMIIKLIKGEKIQDPPVEFPSKIEVIINQKLATQFGGIITK